MGVKIFIYDWVLWCLTGQSPSVLLVEKTSMVM